MNFLAHFHLSHDSPDLIVGNFVADFIKGSKFEGISPGVVKGIQLHRFIDSFTDQHPSFLKSKKLLYEYRHYSGVILDVFYDFLLANQWTQYSNQSLLEFSSAIYQILDSRRAELNDEAKFALDHMIEHDWLQNYATQEGINSSLTGLAERTSFESGMEHAVKVLIEKENEFEADFKLFYPELIQVSTDYYRAL